MNKTYEDLNAKKSSEADSFTLDRYRQFFLHFPSSIQTILDVGCNTGRGGRVLKELNPNFSIVGLDCVESRFEKIPKEIYERIICSYSTNIKAENSSFDAVIAGEFIEHIYPQEVNKSLLEFYRVLKPGGKLLLTTPNPNYFKLKITGGSVLGGAHVSQHYPKKLKKNLQKIGFVDIKLRGSGKVSRFLGENSPILSFYGSYLVIANKNNSQTSSITDLTATASQ